MKKTLITILLAVIGAFGFGYIALAVTSGSAEGDGFYRSKDFLTDVAVTTTSNAMRIAGARSVTLLFESDGPNGSGVGTSTFTVTVDPNGEGTFYPYNKLISNNTSLTRVSTVDITATSTGIYTMDLQGESFYQMKCTSTEVGTTVASCSGLIQW